MTTVQIDYAVSPEALARVSTLLDEVALRDPNWNGADFRIVRGDATCFPDTDSADAVALLHRIFAVIDNRTA